MPAIVTKKFKLNNAEQFVESFSETANTSYYLFIAKTKPWDDNLDISGTINLPIDNEELLYNTYDEMIAMKRIFPINVEYVIPRYNWTSGTTYNQYDHTSNNLFNSAFYVLADTNSFNVYKCISNNKGMPSLVQPSGELTSVITLGDGYKWKYMYTIPIGKRSRFFNSNFMYVSDYNNSSNVDGAIDFIAVTNGGSLYTSTPTVTILGDGSNATATAILSGNSVSTIDVVLRGNGYRYANVIISGGGGSNASAKAMIGPRGGHASNTIMELNGSYVMVSCQLVDSENDIFPIDNDFRMIGIIKDPLLYGTNTIAKGSLYSNRKTLHISNTTGTFNLDENINGSISFANAIITSINADTTNLTANVKFFQSNKFTSNATSFSVGDIIVGASSGATGTLISITNEGIQPDSGQVLYLDTFRPIQRASGQTEILQLVIEF